MKNICDLILLDNNFAICGIVEDYSLLRWTRRYFSCGEFLLIMAPSARETASGARYIYNPENGETAIIERLRITVETAGSGEPGTRTLYMSGRMLESLLSTRVIEGTEVLSGTAEKSARALVQKYAMTGSRAIPRLVLGDYAGYAETAAVQYAGVTLAETLYGLLGSAGLSPRLTYDYNSGNILFTAARGLDRTQAQSINSRAIFSADFENVLSSEYMRDDSNYRNYIYIAGETAENGTRTMAELDLTGGTEERRELFIDAHTVKRIYRDSAGATHTATDDEYAAMLYGRGLETIADYRKAEQIKGIIVDGAPPEYRTDYDLGDLCDYTDIALGIEHTLRITEVTEQRERGVYSVQLKLSI